MCYSTSLCPPSPRSQSPLRSQRCLSCCKMLGHETRPGTTGAPSPLWHSAGERERMTAGEREPLSPKDKPLRCYKNHSLGLFASFFCSCSVTVTTLQLSLHPAVVSLPALRWLPLRWRPMNSPSPEPPNLNTGLEHNHVAKQGRGQSEPLAAFSRCKMEEAYKMSHAHRTFKSFCKNL